MNGLYLQYEELWMETTIRKDRKKVNVHYIVDRNHQRSVILVDHSRNFKGNYLGRRGNYCLKLKKQGTLKTKNLSKITTYIRCARALSTISSRQNQSSASLKLRNSRIHQNLETGHCSICI